MNGHLSAPPEGVLIESARREAKLSIREAARRAGISEGWWRQVVKGYQSLSGGDHGAVRGVPAATVAKMAAVVGVTPEQLETEGERPDAAAILREMNRPGLVIVPSSPSGAPRGLKHGRDLFPSLEPALKAAAERCYWEVEARIIGTSMARADRGEPEPPAGEIPAGADVFPDQPREAAWWDALLAQGLPGRPYTADLLAQALAVALARHPREQSGETTAGAGLAGALAR